MRLLYTEKIVGSNPTAIIFVFCVIHDDKWDFTIFMESWCARITDWNGWPACAKTFCRSRVEWQATDIFAALFVLHLPITSDQTGQAMMDSPRYGFNCNVLFRKSTAGGLILNRHKWTRNRSDREWGLEGGQHSTIKKYSSRRSRPDRRDMGLQSAERKEDGETNRKEKAITSRLHHAS